jgi:hypothetical protein
VNDGLSFGDHSKDALCTLLDTIRQRARRNQSGYFGITQAMFMHVMLVMVFAFVMRMIVVRVLVLVMMGWARIKIVKMFVGVGLNIELRGRDHAPLQRAATDGITIEVDFPQFLLKVRQRKPGIQESTDGHIATDTRETIEVGYAHSAVNGNYPVCLTLH